jgi:ParB-like chromosome segregation protein Spo0J
MNDATLKELAADIKANGQHEPATVSPGGQLLDGRTPAPRPSPRHAPAL